MQFTQNEIARYTKSFYQSGPNECWEWLGAKDKDGYGTFTILKDGKRLKFRVHRISYLLEIGKFDFKLLVLHTCDNPPCVNPKHLFLGTHLDNTRDCIRKGRKANTSGELNGNYQYSETILEEIRRLHRQGFTQTKLIEIFGLSKGHMNRVVHGYRH